MTDMKQYIGTKVILAKPMNLGDYNKYRGWAIPGDEHPDDPGFLVEYTDGGKPNDSRHAGYISWSPQEQFENAYREMRGLTFGMALEALKKGFKVARAGWNGEDQWVALMPELKLPARSSVTEGPKVNERTAKHIGDDTPLDSQPYFVIWTAQKKWQPGWIPSTADVLAEDWRVIE